MWRAKPGSTHRAAARRGGGGDETAILIAQRIVADMRATRLNPGSAASPTVDVERPAVRAPRGATHCQFGDAETSSGSRVMTRVAAGGGQRRTMVVTGYIAASLWW